MFRKWFSERNLDTPLRNVWQFDIGKLVIPGVFFNDDLLNLGAKIYDPISRLVKNHPMENLFKVTPELIREAFLLNPNQALHEPIYFEDLQTRYEAQKVYLRNGSLQEIFVKIGKLPLVTKNTLETLLKKYFNPKA